MSNVLYYATNQHTHINDRYVTDMHFLVNDQRDAQIPFYVCIFIYNSLRVSITSFSSSGETNRINTTSGNCHSVLVAQSFSKSISQVAVRSGEDDYLL